MMVPPLVAHAASAVAGLERSGATRRRLVRGLLLTVGLQPVGAAFARIRAEAGVEHQTRELMGTIVRLTVVAEDPVRRAVALQAAWATLALGSAWMSRHGAGGPLQTLSAAAGQPGWVELPTPVWQVLRQARAVSAATEGAFDATVGAFRDWDFRAGALHRVPHPEALREQRRQVDWQAMVLQERRPAARLLRPGMALDLGGIAKLPLLEAAMQALREHGVRDAMIDGGGDVLCMGRHAGEPWRVGVRDPLVPQRLACVLQLQDGVVASSGDYERAFVQAGQRYHHVLDPATGWPTRGVHGVALLADRVAEVNGLGSAIMVAGLARARGWLAARPSVQALVATDDGHWRTPAWPAALPSA